MKTADNGSEMAAEPYAGASTGEGCGCVTATLALGSNMEPKLSRVLSAISWLSEVCEVECATRPYETPPLGGGSRSYCNAVVRVRYAGELEDLERLVKGYEIAMGRDEECRSLGLVPVDIDIVMADGRILRQRDYDAFYFRKGVRLLEDIIYETF